MNRQHAENLKRNIRAQFSEAEIRLMFGRRLDEELFADVGKCLMSKEMIEHTDEHISIWLGFEHVLGIEK